MVILENKAIYSTNYSEDVAFSDLHYNLPVNIILETL